MADRLLRTWGEIAAVLRVHPSTARWWLPFGLPVYKSGTGRSAPVIARERELLNWQFKRARKLGLAMIR